MPPLALVVTGAPLALRAGDIAKAAVDAGWDVTVVATPASLAWMDRRVVEVATGRPIKDQFRSPDVPKPPRPEAVVVCPLTFNSTNKLVGGIADNYATSLLCESLGSRVPMVMAPMVNQLLWGHPVWQQHLAQLTAWDAVLIDVRTGKREVEAVPSGSGQEVVDRFDPRWLLSALPASP
jgi:phosphopantothenoylcysteine synthetase/decarboxylase